MKPGARPGPARVNRRCDPQQPAGVTILELLIVIAVVTVLLSMSMAAFRSVRVQSGRTQSLTRARSIASDLRASATQTGRWPYTDQRETASSARIPDVFPSGVIVVPWWPDGSYRGTDSRWDLSLLWPGLIQGVAPWETHYTSWISPGHSYPTLDSLRQSNVWRSPDVSYRYSNSFVASPGLWSGQASADESLIAPTRPEDVAFPANKVLVWDGDLAYLPAPPKRAEGHWFAPTPMAFADGHAAVRQPLDATPGAPNPLNDNSSVRLHNTPDGVLGRDY